MILWINSVLKVFEYFVIIAVYDFVEDHLWYQLKNYINFITVYIFIKVFINQIGINCFIFILFYKVRDYADIPFRDFLYIIFALQFKIQSVVWSMSIMNQFSLILTLNIIFIVMNFYEFKLVMYTVVATFLIGNR